MIRTNTRDFTFQLPNLERCKADRCNLYQLIVQNRMTKQVVVCKVRDLTPHNPLRFMFRIELPGWLDYGEYSYCLVSADEWHGREVERHYIGHTCRKPDLSGLADHGLLLVNNGKVVVDVRFPVGIMAEDGRLEFYDFTPPEGSRTLELCVLTTGLIVFERPGETVRKTPRYEQPQTKQEYKTYKRNGSKR